MDEVVDEEEHLKVAVDHRDSLKEEKRGWRRMKTPLQVAVDQKASCKTWSFPAHRDSSGMYYKKLVVQDPIQKCNYRIGD